MNTGDTFRTRLTNSEYTVSNAVTDTENVVSNSKSDYLLNM